MRVNTVKDLKEYLEEFPDNLQVMIVHQPSWPLREYIGGLWLDDGTPEDDDQSICEHCQRQTLSEPLFREGSLDGEVNDDGWYAECFRCHKLTEVQEPVPESEQVLYLVASGHPYEGTPYGSKRAWGAI